MVASFQRLRYFLDNLFHGIQFRDIQLSLGCRHEFGRLQEQHIQQTTLHFGHLKNGLVACPPIRFIEEVLSLLHPAAS
jgi:hypothetical protein